MRPRPVPASLLAVAARQQALVSAAQCAEAGISADRRATLVRLGTWSRVTRAVYDTEPERAGSLGYDERRRRSAWIGLLAYGPRAVAVGSCALALHGVMGLPLSITPEVSIPRASDRCDRDGIHLREFDNGMTSVLLDGRLVATADWGLAQAVPELGRAHAVAVMDSALHLGLLDQRSLAAAHRLARGRRGVARTHEWWTLADGRAESPLETFGRLDCLDLGVPPDELQVEIRDGAGRFVARGDMGWRIDDAHWLIAEMDGREWHETPGAVLEDRHRQNALMGLAHVLRFTAADTREPGRIGATVRRTLSRLRAGSGRTRG